MGQVFSCCVYDTEAMEASTYYADKFYSSCYSYSDPVMNVHYLLRQKPYRVMWIGDYLIDDGFPLLTGCRESDLLGYSTLLDKDFFEGYDEQTGQEDNNKEKADKLAEHAKAVAFIDENSTKWKKLDLQDRFIDYFKNVKMYEGYLINHDQKKAINLFDYWDNSMFYSYEPEMQEIAIDLIPVLTETGEGSRMAVGKGVYGNTTLNLDGQWCGDLLQIVDDVPDGFELVKYCYVDIIERCIFCYYNYGKDVENFVLDKDGTRYYGYAVGIFGEVLTPFYFNFTITKEDGKGLRIKGVPVKEVDGKEPNTAEADGT
jgi:hypothetical protein